MRRAREPRGLSAVSSGWMANRTQSSRAVGEASALFITSALLGGKHQPCVSSVPPEISCLPPPTQPRKTHTGRIVCIFFSHLLERWLVFQEGGQLHLVPARAACPSSAVALREAAPSLTGSLPGITLSPGLSYHKQQPAAPFVGARRCLCGGICWRQPWK